MVTVRLRGAAQLISFLLRTAHHGTGRPPAQLGLRGRTVRTSRNGFGCDSGTGEASSTIV